MYMSFFFALKIFFFFLVLSTLSTMNLGKIFYIFILIGLSWASWNYKFMSFIKTGKFRSYFFKYFFPISFSPSFPLGIPIIHNLALRLCSFYYHLYPQYPLSFRLDNFCWFKFIDSSFISNLLLSTASDYLNIVFFNSKISGSF